MRLRRGYGAGDEIGNRCRIFPLNRRNRERRVEAIRKVDEMRGIELAFHLVVSPSYELEHSVAFINHRKQRTSEY
jgi:hypothetical protein